MPVMTLRGRGSGRGGRVRGYGCRRCGLCDAKVVYASKLVVDCSAIEPGCRNGTVVCDPCLKARPWMHRVANPLPVLTVEQARREGLTRDAQRKTRRSTKRCRPCGGVGCHNCEGKGRVVA